MKDEKTNNLNSQPAEFHIGLTMAGAVSAGCYTAGVMDYLFEILELWEKAKIGQLPEGWNPDMLSLIPDHKVIIDVMGGASAGGMATVMSAIYAMKGKINPVTNPSNVSTKKDNLLYDSWVLMGDDATQPTKLFEKTLALDDFNENKILSLLNSNFIDSICDNAFIDDVGELKKKPNYVSDELEILLSQTMLRSVPLSIDFTTKFGSLRNNPNYPNYNTFEHFVISHFKLDYDDKNPQHKDFYLPFDPFNNKKDIERLKLATMATGAFPIGLSFRKFFKGVYSSDYIKNNSKKLIHNKITLNSIPQVPVLNFKDLSDPFDFIGVDGGAINNEPFGEVLNVLKARYGEKEEGKPDKFALLLIDPFPDHNHNKEYKQPDDIFKVIPAIIGTLWDQSKVKRKEVLEFNAKNYFIGEIYPVRYNKQHKLEEHHIACSSAYAFGGFLDINFRHHDFFLGRDNARNFFNVYFSFEYDPENNNVHPVHENWSPEMVEKFIFKRKDTATEKYKFFLPIIPNLNELKDKLDNIDSNPFRRTVKTWPTYNPELLFALKPKIENRVKKMLELTIDKFSDSTKDSEHPVTEKWIKKYYREGIFKRITGWIGGKLFGAIISLNKGTFARKAAKATIEWILKDLEDKKLIK